MNDAVRQFRDFFVSLKLTVVLLSLSIVLIFAATLHQQDLGVWGVQQRYFHSFFVLWNVGSIPVPVFPGGYFLGGLLFINLIAAHVYRFRMSWKKSGIFLTHLGLMLLLIGELLSGLMQEESRMRLREGETKNYSESARHYELAITETTNPDYDEVWVVPQEILAKRETVQMPGLPFRIVPKEYYPAINPQRRADVPNAAQVPETMGLGSQFIAVPAAYDNRDGAVNPPGAYVELVGEQGSLGTWLTFYLPPEIIPSAQLAKTFEYAGRNWKIALRPERKYRPFSLTLLDFRHDIYAGTNIPKNFSSRVVLNAPGDRDNHEVLIYMNNPLRHDGLTFYQSGYDPNDDKVTILQVVRNPSWQLPYVSCALLSLGLIVQFGIHLFGFVRRRTA